jgi:acyl-CoA thioesterase II
VIDPRGQSQTRVSQGQAAFEGLCEVLRPTRDGPSSFYCQPWPVQWGIPFGGLLVAQAYGAAALTVPGAFWVRSLHAYFLQAGRDDKAVDMDVTTVRDGRGTSWRAVDVLQHERPLLRVELMFSADADGPGHQNPMPPAPHPDALENVGSALAPFGEDTFRPWGVESPFDLRYATSPPRIGAQAGAGEARSMAWLRALGSPGDDRTLATALLVYASDMCMLDSCLRPQAMWFGGGSAEGRTLDHSMWFHAAPRLDDWILMDQRSPGMRDGRGLGLADLYASDGELLCSVAQLGAIRSIDRG